MITTFDVVSHPDFPIGWQRDMDFVEGILVVAALELQARRRISMSSPFDDRVFNHLDQRFRYDPFASLISRQERIGRLPLLALVWQFADETISDLEYLRPGNPDGYQRALSKLTGVVLGKYGTALFMAAFERRWYFGRDSEMTPTEEVFSEGDPIFGAGGQGILAANGALFMDSIWPIAFRLIERRSPEHYLNKLNHRVEPVLDLLDRGAARGLAGHSKWDQWPGWRER